MTQAAPQSVLEIPLLELVSQAKAMPSLHQRVPKWKTAITSVDQSHRCYWCGKASQELQPDHIIALGCGGTNASANVVVACQSCARRKGAHDALAWCQGDPAKLKRRLAALSSGLCHPLVEPIRDRGTVHKHLAKRWGQERFAIHWAAGTLLWPCVSPPPGHVLAALRAMGGRLHDVGRWKALTLAQRHRDALDMLVSCNALVRTLDGYEGPVVLPDAAAVVRFQAKAP